MASICPSVAYIEKIATTEFDLEDSRNLKIRSFEALDEQS
jgi:hypothetical protein